MVVLRDVIGIGEHAVRYDVRDVSDLEDLRHLGAVDRDRVPERAYSRMRR